MQKPRAVLSMSGGMDSAALLLNLLTRGKEIFPVAFDYGQRHKYELEKAKELVVFLQKLGHPVKDLKILDLKCLADLLPSALTTSSDKVPTGGYEEESMKAIMI